MVTKEEARKNVEEFLQLYKKHLAEGKFEEQKEANTEKYIEDLFEKLGWDRYDLERQHTIKEGRVDYAVNLDGHPYFFVEVKKYSTKDLDQHKKQAIDYAWQAQIKWVVLTNLREFRIYNAEYKGQSEEIMRVVLPIQVDQLLDRFSHLWWLSKEAAKENLIEKEAVTISKVKLKEPISALSGSLLRWRSLLTKEMKAHPKLNEISGLDKDAANEWVDEAVQMLLNRFIFLRTIESLGQWAFSLRAVRNKWRDNKKKHLMEYVSEFFREADAKYNAGLFAKHKCEDLHLDDEILDRIIEETYVDKVHDVEWDFRALVSDQDILGLAYEQYLGATLTEKTAKVKESKEKRKKMGIYYTPKYVVDYIVENTLGEVLKKTKDQDITNLKILDPACGSGSFIKDAYRRLTKEISKRGVDKQLYLNKESSEETQFSIYDTALKNCIKGVDLDTKAVEMARLNLLILGAETGVHRLPNIDESIQKGNSLVDNFAIAGKNAFVWEERFKDVFEQGGFDIVIGNPPYGAELNNEERKFILKNYPATANNTDTAIAFINQAFKLLRKGGYLGFIVPKPLIYSQKWIACRDFIKDDLISIVDVSKAFEDVLLEQVIIIIKKGSNTKEYSIDFIDKTRKPIKIDKRLIKDFRNLINDVSNEELNLAKKLNSGRYISDIAKIERGLMLQDILQEKGEFPVLRGKCIGRYFVKNTSEFITKENYRKIAKEADYLLKPKIIIQNIVAHVTKPKNHIILMAAIDERGLLALDNVGCVSLIDQNLDKSFLVALLNSKLMSWYAYRFIYAKAIRTMRLDKYHLSKMPLCEYKGKKEYNTLIQLAQKMLDLNKQIFELNEKQTNEKILLAKARDKLDLEIDGLIYKLYGITEKEKKIIEESLK